MVILLMLFGLITIIIGIIIGIIFLIKNSHNTPFSNNCKKLCHDLFKDSTGVTYENACNNTCNNGINLNKQEQCEWCAKNQSPMSGYNKACQKYINLNQDKKPNNIFKPECCGKGGFIPFKNQCN